MGGMAGLACVVLVMSSIVFQVVICTGTRVIFLGEPSTSYVRNYLERQQEQKTPFNHDFAGFTDQNGNAEIYGAPPLPPPGFNERTVRVHLGDGKTCYKRARSALLRWQMHDGSSWARIVQRRKSSWSLNSQIQMATVAKAMAGLAWCINPCQVLYERKDRTVTFLAPPESDRRQPLRNYSKANVPLVDRGTTTDTAHGIPLGRLWAGGSPRSAPLWASFGNRGRCRGIQSAVAYATKQGHLIQGEERMRVVWFRGRGDDGSVWFEVYSVSRGAGIVGGVVFPFVRSMQRRFFHEQAETMRCIVRSSF